MKCPHCLEGFHEAWSATKDLGHDNDYLFSVRDCTCPDCHKKIAQLGKMPLIGPDYTWNYIYPKAISRAPLPKEVDDKTLTESYSQACLVLADSPMASAALSRRALQHILREKAVVKRPDLSLEIDDVIASNSLPSDLAGNLDAVRLIGNFAAHPMKSTNSGEIIDVEPGEAEWNLEVVEQLMDFYFVRPAKSKEKKIALNEKLKAAGKPELPL